MELKGKYLLGFDVGTYESKGVICDHAGNILTSKASKHVLKNPKPGWAEHDPVNDWWKDFKTVVREMLDETGILPEEISGIGISAICTALVPVDRDFNPLRNAILYGIDSRSLPQCEEMNAMFTPEELARYGGPFTVEFVSPKILWVKENEPEVFARTDKFTMAAGWLVGKLTGVNVSDKYSMGALSPLLDPVTFEYNEEICEKICPSRMLPKVADSTYSVIGAVTEKAAAETGLAAGTPVIAGTTDAGAEAVSVGVVEPGDAMLMYGSTAFWVVAAGVDTVRRLGIPYEHYTIDGVACFAGGMATTGSLTRWLLDKTARELVAREEAGGPSAYGTLFREAEGIPVGSDGLICLPYFMGERQPIQDPHAKGMFFGLNLMHTRGHLIHAAFEGIAYGIDQNLNRMREMGLEVNTLTAVGGGTKAPLWLQIVSDVCGVRQIVPEVTVGASYGDALMAGLGVGVIDSPASIKKMVKVKYVTEPDAAKHEKYGIFKKIYSELYERNKDLMHDLWQGGEE